MLLDLSFVLETIWRIGESECGSYQIISHQSHTSKREVVGIV